MKTAYTNKEIWKIAYPCLISLVMEQLIGMTDTAFLGRVGEVELGASAIASVYYMVIFMMGFGFSAGAQIIMARRNGEQNYREVGSVFYHGLYFLMGFAVVMFALSKAVSPLRVEDTSAGLLLTADARVQVRVYTLYGVLVKALPMQAGETVQIDLAPGVYIVNQQKVVVYGK